MRGLMHSKPYRQLKDRLSLEGIDLEYGDTTNGGSFKLHIKYQDVEANAFASLRTGDPRWLDNAVRACKQALRGKGAALGLTHEEVEPAVGEPVPKDILHLKSPKRRITRLTREEKRNFYELYKSKAGTFLECCGTYSISSQTGGKIIADYEKEEREVESKPTPVELPSPPPVQPRKQAFSMPEEPAVKRASLLDPEYLGFLSELSRLKERLNELQTKGKDFGLLVTFDLRVS